MDFDSIEKFREYGFEGFMKISDLMETACADVPSVKGIYFVLLMGSKPKFLPKSTGGHFKGKEPTVDINVLEANWVKNTFALYIGKAGGGTSRKTLRDRIKQYMRFGQGKNVGHWGGRFIWQLTDSKDLLMCWKKLLEGNPREFEKSLIAEFKTQYGKIPFANLQV